MRLKSILLVCVTFPFLAGALRAQQPSKTAPKRVPQVGISAVGGTAPTRCAEGIVPPNDRVRMRRSRFETRSYYGPVRVRGYGEIDAGAELTAAIYSNGPPDAFFQLRADETRTATRAAKGKEAFFRLRSFPTSSLNVAWREWAIMDAPPARDRLQASNPRPVVPARQTATQSREELRRQEAELRRLLQSAEKRRELCGRELNSAVGPRRVAAQQRFEAANRAWNLLHQEYRIARQHLMDAEDRRDRVETASTPPSAPASDRRVELPAVERAESSRSPSMGLLLKALLGGGVVIAALFVFGRRLFTPAPTDRSAV